MIYLASPYTHEQSDVRTYRYIQACKAAAVLIDDGHAVYCPIAHSHGIAVHGGLDSDWAAFQAIDEYFLSLCDRLVVLTIPGYDKSEGIKAEIAIARKLGKPIEYMEPIDGVSTQAEVDSEGFQVWLQAMENLQGSPDFDQ